jgi:Na+/H+ antiporter NhaD/arsenite permease-like protein
MRSRLRLKRLVFCALTLWCAAYQPAAAAAPLPGAAMTWPWVLPFLGILVFIATSPLFFPKIWHDHYGKVAFAWAAITVLPLALAFGLATALAAVLHVLGEYLNFILLLFALYVTAGGILITGERGGTPRANIAVLALGTVIASIVGTTGAAMILIRPLIRANAWRTHNTHVFIFFIFLVANIGGALTPLGDPPLFVGLLRGVEFTWTARHLWLQTAIVAMLVLMIFFAIEVWRYGQEPATREGSSAATIQIRSRRNILLIAAIIVTILAAATWNSRITIDLYGTDLALENVLRNAILIVIALASLILTREEHRDANNFTFGPMTEVAILFARIFVAIVPVIAMLQAGRDGSFAFLLQAVTAQRRDAARIRLLLAHWHPIRIPR